MPEEDPWTLRRLLQWTTAFFERKDVDAPRLSAELLLSHAISAPRIKLYTEIDRVLEEPALGLFRGLVKRAAEHEPIAYLTGRAHFFNLEFEVNRDVLIPRPDTETLVENVLQQVRYQPGLESPRVLDLCTGTGCIAAAIANQLKGAMVLAIDKSEAALEVARRNIESLKLSDRVVLACGDLFEPLETSITAAPFDLIVSNPPYIPSAQIDTLDRSVRDYEPRLALDGGEDGLELVRRIFQGATARLNPGGTVYVEIMYDQGPAASEIARASGFADVRVLRDHGNRERVVRAQLTRST